MQHLTRSDKCLLHLNHCWIQEQAAEAMQISCKIPEQKRMLAARHRWQLLPFAPHPLLCCSEQRQPVDSICQAADLQSLAHQVAVVAVLMHAACLMLRVSALMLVADLWHPAASSDAVPHYRSAALHTSQAGQLLTDVALPCSFAAHC